MPGVVPGTTSMQKKERIKFEINFQLISNQIDSRAEVSRLPICSAARLFLGGLFFCSSSAVPFLHAKEQRVCQGYA